MDWKNIDWKNILVKSAVGGLYTMMAEITVVAGALDITLVNFKTTLLFGLGGAFIRGLIVFLTTFKDNMPKTARSIFRKNGRLWATIKRAL